MNCDAIWWWCEGEKKITFEVNDFYCNSRIKKVKEKYEKLGYNVTISERLVFLDAIWHCYCKKEKNEIIYNENSVFPLSYHEFLEFYYREPEMGWSTVPEHSKKYWYSYIYDLYEYFKIK
jgi:hypothetical protein